MKITSGIHPLLWDRYQYRREWIITYIEKFLSTFNFFKKSKINFLYYKLLLLYFGFGFIFMFMFITLTFHQILLLRQNNQVLWLQNHLLFVVILFQCSLILHRYKAVTAYHQLHCKMVLDFL